MPRQPALPRLQSFIWGDYANGKSSDGTRDLVNWWSFSTASEDVGKLTSKVPASGVQRQLVDDKSTLRDFY